MENREVNLLPSGAVTILNSDVLINESAERETRINFAAYWLLIAGFILVFVGLLVLVAASAIQGNMEISGGGIVFIGPIPVIFGAGPNAYLAIILAAILTIVGFLVFFWLRKKSVSG